MMRLLALARVLVTTVFGSSLIASAQGVLHLAGRQDCLAGAGQFPELVACEREAFFKALQRERIEVLSNIERQRLEIADSAQLAKGPIVVFCPVSKQ